jgi:hypothetical protein
MNQEYVLAITMITAWLSFILTSHYVKMKKYNNHNKKIITEKFTAIYDDIPIPKESKDSKQKAAPLRCGADFIHEFINRELQLERDIWFRDMLVNDAKNSVDEFCTNSMGLKEVTERYDNIINRITKNILLK